MMLQPLLQHHDHPDHDAIIAGMAGTVLINEVIEILRPQITPAPESMQALVRQIP